LRFLERFDSVFDVVKPTVSASALSDGEIEALIAERQQARKSKNFQRADAIRNELLEKGVILEDTKEGMRWKRK
jgi:cysteinyl-tRNA synthetase